MIKNDNKKFFISLIFILLVFLNVSPIFSVIIEAKFSDKEVKKDFVVCYKDNLHFYDCNYLNKAWFIRSYNNSSFILVDSYGYELNVYFKKLSNNSKFDYIRDHNKILIKTKNLYFYSILKVPKTDIYQFYFNGKLSSFFDKDDYYLVPIISDGELIIKKLIDLQKNKKSFIFEARTVNPFKICLDYIKENNKRNLTCYSLDKYPYQLVFIRNLNFLEFKDPINNTFILRGLKIFNNNLTIYFENKSINNYYYEEHYKIKLNKETKELNFVWSKRKKLKSYEFFVNNQQVKPLLKNNSYYLQIFNFREANIEILAYGEIPIIVKIGNKEILTNESEDLDSYYYRKQKKLIVINKKENLKAVFENASFKDSELPEVEFYVLNKNKGEITVRVAALRNLNYSKAYIKLNIPGKVLAVYKNNGTGEIKWDLFEYLDGEIKVFFNEKDPDIKIKYLTTEEKQEVNTSLYNFYLALLFFILLLFLRH